MPGQPRIARTGYRRELFDVPHHGYGRFVLAVVQRYKTTSTVLATRHTQLTSSSNSMGIPLCTCGNRLGRKHGRLRMAINRGLNSLEGYGCQFRIKSKLFSVLLNLVPVYPVKAIRPPALEEREASLVAFQISAWYFVQSNTVNLGWDSGTGV